MYKAFVGIVALLLFLWAVTLPQSASTQTPIAPTQAVPPDAAAMTNPVKPTEESLAKSKKMYGYDCAMCHGETGNGKGELATELKLKLIDFTSPEAMKTVTDGEMFYVIKNGKDKMPAEGDRLKSEELWNMVSYVRSFAKK